MRQTVDGARFYEDGGLTISRCDVQGGPQDGARLIGIVDTESGEMRMVVSVEVARELADCLIAFAAIQEDDDDTQADQWSADAEVSDP